MNLDTSPIAAIATAPGRGGIGVVRASGKSLAPLIDRAVPRRHAHAAPRHLHPVHGKPTAASSTRASRSVFKGPHSYTGEDVLELQGHGGPVVLQMLLARVLEAGARSRPAPGRAGRIHPPRLPQRQARPGPGRSGGRPDRRLHRSGGQVGLAVAVGRVLEGHQHAGRTDHRPAHAGRSHARLPGRRNRLPRKIRRARPAGRHHRLARPRVPPGGARRAAARRPERGAGRPAERRQVVAAQCAGRRRRRHRHADRRHHARQGQRNHPDRRHPAQHHRHRRHPHRSTKRSTWSNASASSAPGAKWPRPT